MMTSNISFYMLLFKIQFLVLTSFFTSLNHLVLCCCCSCHSKLLIHFLKFEGVERKVMAEEENHAFDNDSGVSVGRKTIDEIYTTIPVVIPKVGMKFVPEDAAYAHKVS